MVSITLDEALPKDTVLSDEELARMGQGLQVPERPPPPKRVSIVRKQTPGTRTIFFFSFC